MNRVQTFSFGPMDVHVIEESGQPGFVAVDVYKPFGLTAARLRFEPAGPSRRDLESANLCR